MTWYLFEDNILVQLEQETDKNTRRNHIHESQEVSPFPVDDHKAAMNRQESMTNTKHK